MARTIDMPDLAWVPPKYRASREDAQRWQDREATRRAREARLQKYPHLWDTEPQLQADLEDMGNYAHSPGVFAGEGPEGKGLEFDPQKGFSPLRKQYEPTLGPQDMVDPRHRRILERMKREQNTVPGRPGMDLELAALKRSMGGVG